MNILPYKQNIESAFSNTYHIVNSKPAIEWVIERLSITNDKDSVIVNELPFLEIDYTL
jgi:predicted helicase